MPPLDLYYLTISRHHRLARMRKYAPPVVTRAVQPTRVYAQHRLLGLYQKLSGRWQVEANTVCKAEEVRVCSHTDGKVFLQVGEYLTHTYDEGDVVSARQRNQFTSGTVVSVHEENVCVLYDGQTSPVTVGYEDLSRGTTPGSTFFVIDKGARSVTLVYNGNRVVSQPNKRRVRRLHKGGEHTYQWSLKPESTEDRLVWSGGGSHGEQEIVWVRKQARSASTYHHEYRRMPEWVTGLRRKRVRPPRVTNHSACACGNIKCNEVSTSLGSVFQKTCSWARPHSRPLNAAQLASMSSSKKRKALRSQAIQQVMKRLSREAGCEKEEPSPANNAVQRTALPAKVSRSFEKVTDST